MSSVILSHIVVEVVFAEGPIMSRGSVINIVPVITGLGYVREPLKMSITRVNNRCCGNRLGSFLEGRLAIQLALELLRKSEETVTGRSERFHDGFNICGSYVTVGNFHEVKEALNSGYDQGVNIVKEVCKELFRGSLLEID